jgi:hypothetical protein
MAENAPAAGWEEHDHEALVDTHRHFHVTLRVPIIRPCWSGSMPVFVEGCCAAGLVCGHQRCAIRSTAAAWPERVTRQAGQRRGTGVIAMTEGRLPTVIALSA